MGVGTILLPPRLPPELLNPLTSPIKRRTGYPAGNRAKERAPKKFPNAELLPVPFYAARLQRGVPAAFRGTVTEELQEGTDTAAPLSRVTPRYEGGSGFSCHTGQEPVPRPSPSGVLLHKTGKISQPADYGIPLIS